MFKPEGSEEGSASLKSECLDGGRTEMMHTGVTTKAVLPPKRNLALVRLEFAHWLPQVPDLKTPVVTGGSERSVLPVASSCGGAVVMD